MVTETKNALETVLKLGSKVVEAQADGRITFGESVGIAMTAVGLIHVFKDLPLIKVELSNITDTDVEELVDSFTANVNIPNEGLKEKILAGITVLEQLVLMFVKKAT